MTEPTCPACRRPIDLLEAQPVAINPQGLTDEQVLDAYEQAKEQEAASPSKSIVRGLYMSAGAARLGAYAPDERNVADVPEDELVILGRALFELGAESYAVHPECVGSEAFDAWMKTKLGLEDYRSPADLDERIRRFRAKLDE